MGRLLVFPQPRVFATSRQPQPPHSGTQLPLSFPPRVEASPQSPQQAVELPARKAA